MPPVAWGGGGGETVDISDYIEMISKQMKEVHKK